MQKIHIFRECLERSHAHAEAPWWSIIYRTMFPTLAAMVNVRKDGWAQRGGIDRVLTLECGRVIKVDEKVREKDYGDIALERFSDEERRIPGWVQKPLACDFIAYAVKPSARCWLLPTIPLQRAWQRFGRKWVSDYPFEIRSLNEGYVTLSTGVPPAVLLKAIGDVMYVEWEQAPPCEPLPATPSAMPITQLQLPLGEAVP